MNTDFNEEYIYKFKNKKSSQQNANFVTLI